VARFSVTASDPAGRVPSASEPAGRTRPLGYPYGMWLRQMDCHFAGVGDGLSVSLEDGHQETKGVLLEGRCGNVLPWRMLPLTDDLKQTLSYLSFLIRLS